MLRKFILVALIICAILILLSEAMILVGQRQSRSEADLFNYLGKCGGQPCYLGIVPGLTPLDAALATFKNMPGMEFDPNTNIASNPPGFLGSVLLLASEQNKSMVGAIILEMQSTDTSIGSLIARFGAPCVVSDLGGGVGTIFPGMSVVITRDQLGTDHALKPLTSVFRMNLFNNVESCDDIPDLEETYPWHGFTRYTN